MSWGYGRPLSRVDFCPGVCCRVTGTHGPCVSGGGVLPPVSFLFCLSLSSYVFLRACENMALGARKLDAKWDLQHLRAHCARPRNYAHRALGTKALLGAQRTTILGFTAFKHRERGGVAGPDRERQYFRPGRGP